MSNWIERPKRKLKREDLITKEVTFTLSADEAIFPAEDDCDYCHRTDRKPSKQHFKEIIEEMFNVESQNHYNITIFNGDFEVECLVKKEGRLVSDMFEYDLDDDFYYWGYIEHMYDVEYDVIIRCSEAIASVFARYCGGKFPGKFTFMYGVHQCDLNFTVWSIKDIK